MQDGALRPGNLFACQIGSCFDGRVFSHNVEGLGRAAVDADYLEIDTIRGC